MHSLEHIKALQWVDRVLNNDSIFLGVFSLHNMSLSRPNCGRKIGYKHTYVSSNWHYWETGQNGNSYDNKKLRCKII